MSRTRVRLFLLVTLMISMAGAGANGGGYLIPIGPNFDVGDGPRARRYAKLCEEKLFTRSGWIVRYHSISESAETGLSISRDHRGIFLVTVKQARPQLGSTVFLALDMKLDVKETLKMLKIEEAHAEIPEAVAMAVREYWMSLLSDQRPYERGSSSFIANSVLLFAKSAEGKSLGGRVPPDGYKYRHLEGVEDIVVDLIRLTVERRKNHDRIFRRIERTAGRAERGQS